MLRFLGNLGIGVLRMLHFLGNLGMERLRVLHFLGNLCMREFNITQNTRFPDFMRNLRNGFLKLWL